MDKIQELIWEICDDLGISRNSTALEITQMMADRVSQRIVVLNREQRRRNGVKRKR